MKLKYGMYLFSFMLCVDSFIYSQDFTSVTNTSQIHNHDGRSASDIVMDDENNIYLTGSFNRSWIVGSDTIKSSNFQDMFLAKFDSAGNVIWVARGGGDYNAGDSGNALAIDSDGNIYVTGGFFGDATFGHISITSTAYFGPSMFLAKYDRNGNILWVTQVGGASSNTGIDIALDQYGNPHITGRFIGNPIFGGTPLSSPGSQNVFIAKYHPSGSVQWAIQSKGSEGNIPGGIAVDMDGNIVVTGSFKGNMEIGNVILESKGFQDIFLSKFNSNGHPIWTKREGGISSFRESGNAVTIDSFNNIYITGQFSEHVEFGNTLVESKGRSDVFVAKYSSDGQFNWVNTGGGISHLASSNDSGLGLLVDHKGNCLVTGRIVGFGSHGRAEFDEVILKNSHVTNVFVAYYDPKGQLLWATQGGSQNFDYGTGIVLDKNGNAIVTGKVGAPTSNFGLIEIENNSEDLFLARLDVSRANKAGLILGNAEVKKDSSTCIPLSINNFGKVTSLTTGITWPSNGLQLIEINSKLDSSIYIDSSQAYMGELKIEWDSINSNSTSIQEDQILLEMCFKASSFLGSKLDICFSNLPDCDVSMDIEGVPSKEFFVENGLISISRGNNEDGVWTIIPDLCIGNATSVCVPVSSKNFRDIIAMQFGMRFDPEVLEYTNVINVRFEDLTVGDFQADQGKLRVIQVSDSMVTLADYTDMFEVCFNIIGSANESSTLEIIDFDEFTIEFAFYDGIIFDAVDFNNVNGSVTLGDIDTDDDGICDMEDSCSDLPGEIGDSCDDQDPITSNDMINADCICQGAKIIPTLSQWGIIILSLIMIIVGTISLEIRQKEMFS